MNAPALFDVAANPKHPAKYTDVLLPVHAEVLAAGGKLSGPNPEQVYEDYRRHQEDAWNAPENASIRAAWAAGQEMRRVRAK